MSSTLLLLTLAQENPAPPVSFGGDSIVVLAISQASGLGASGSGEGSTTLAMSAYSQNDTVPPGSGEGTLTVGDDWTMQIPAQMAVTVLSPTLVMAPTALTVAVAEAVPEMPVDFYIDDVLVWTAVADAGGMILALTINVDETIGTAGTHTLRAEQAGATSATATFTIQREPAAAPIVMGPDAPAVEVPEAETPTGVNRWVLQDLLPGGLGSWVMPANPEEMSSPFLERKFSTKHTTAVKSGQFHVTESGLQPMEWTFSGFAWSQEMHDKLLAYGDLNRRFYVIDHRKRAFKVVFLDVALEPALRKNYNGLEVDGHDYQVTALVFDQTWVTMP